MKIGVITFHHVDNFGAVWQCYGLCNTLRKIGHEPFLVNYRPTSALPAYRMPRGRFFVTLRMLSYFKKRIAFQKFRREHLPNQTKCYASYAELSADPPQADVFIAGSDQIWNPDLLGGKYDPAYFLKFATSSRKISYAASFGESSELQFDATLEDFLSGFDAVSVREVAAAVSLGKKFNIDVKVACDPAFLTCDYSKFLKPHAVMNRPYVFCYNLFNRPTTDDLCGQLASYNKCAVRRINDSWRTWQHTAIPEFGIGPVRWLNVLHQASHVVSDSFHATLFSVMLRKNFVVVLANRNRGPGNRIVSMLGFLGLKSRIICKDDTFEDVIRRMEQPVDWDKVSGRISDLRDRSMEFLRLAIGGDASSL